MKYTYIRQQDATDCAAACLAMVCLYYKKETTITRLRDMMGTDIKGTNLIGLSKCAGLLGFTSQAVRVDKEGFLSKYTLPAIANIITKEGLSHFVVIFKITKNHVILGDPAKDLIRIKIDEFYENFTGTMLILKPNEEFSGGKLKGEKIFSRFIRLLLPQIKLFIYSILASVILTVLGIVSSLFNKIIMDEILPYRLENTLLMMLIIFAIIAAVQVVVGFVRQWIMLYLSQKIDIPLMLDIHAEAHHLYQELEEINGDIELKNITFRYGNRKPVLKNISFTIPNGKKVALVGASGSGKSTIAKLLLKYYEPESGEILIDGVDIQEYDNRSLRKAISYVPQTIELFSKSIYDNIRVSRMNSTLEEVKEAAKAVDAKSKELR